MSFDVSKWRFVFVLLVLLVPSRAWCDANVSVSLDPERGTVQETFSLTITLTGEHAAQVDAPSFTDSEQFAIVNQGVNKGITIVNGSVSTSISFIFAITPSLDLKPGKYDLPQAAFRIGGKDVPLRAISLEIVKDIPQADSDPTVASDEQLSFVQTVDDLNPYVGQQLHYQAQLASTLNLTDADLSDMQFQGFFHESLGKPEESIRAVGAKRARIISVHEALFPIEPGTVVIPSRTLTATIAYRANRGIRSGSTFDYLFRDFPFSDDFQTKKKRFQAQSVPLQVKPLPPAPVPGLGYIPVGSVELKSSISRSQIRQGDSTTLTIELSGDAYLKPVELKLPASLEKHFKIYREEPEISSTIRSRGLDFKKTFKVALVPLEDHDVTIDSIGFVVFDPHAKSYKQLKTDPFKLTVIPNAESNELVVRGGQNVNSGSAKQNSTDLPEQPTERAGLDIRPQKVAPDAFASRLELVRWSVWMLLLLMPAVAVAVRAYVYRQRYLVANADVIRQRTARERALNSVKALADNSNDAQTGDVLSKTFQEFLCDRFRVKAGGLTPHDARNLVEVNTKNDSLAEISKSLLKELDGYRFSGLPRGSDLTDICRRTMQTIEQIDKTKALS